LFIQRSTGRRQLDHDRVVAGVDTTTYATARLPPILRMRTGWAESVSAVIRALTSRATGRQATPPQPTAPTPNPSSDPTNDPSPPAVRERDGEQARKICCCTYPGTAAAGALAYNVYESVNGGPMTYGP